ncbi:MDGA1 protein, partial [Polypterus senegalus]|nr:MDGA1 protein [Polypterus senegalus]
MSFITNTVLLVECHSGSRPLELRFTTQYHGINSRTIAYLDKPNLTVHQTISDVRGSYYQEKTVFLRCTVNSNPPARFIWKRDSEVITHNQDNGVDIYEPLYTQCVYVKVVCLIWIIF